MLLCPCECSQNFVLITSAASSRSARWSSDSFSSLQYAMEYAFMRFHSISGAFAEDKRKNRATLGYICWFFATTKNVTDEKCFAMQNFIRPTRKCGLSGRDVFSELVWCSEPTTTRTRNNLIKFYGHIVTVAKKCFLSRAQFVFCFETIWSRLAWSNRWIIRDAWQALSGQYFIYFWNIFSNLRIYDLFDGFPTWALTFGF